MAGLTAAILAGGQSRRMGMDKALVMFQDKPLVVHVLNRLRLLPADQIFLISRQANQYPALQIPVFADLIPDLGPIGGLWTALSYANHDLVVVVGCDMPFINSRLIVKLLELQSVTRYDAVVPRWHGEPQPLHAVYHRNCLPKVASALAAGTRRFQELLDQLHIRWLNEPEYASLEPDGLAFTNLNTPIDLERAASFLTGMG